MSLAIDLEYVVLRCADLERSLAFYELLGFEFAGVKHGAGAQHYSCRLGDFVLELYPASSKLTASVRLGLRVPSVDVVVERLKRIVGQVVRVAAGAAGPSAVVRDPDGNAIELAERPRIADGQPPTFDLGLARLRSLRATDAEALHAYLQEPAVTELTSYPVVSLSLAETIIERSRARWAAGELSKWGLARADNDRLVGTCGFNEWSAVHRWAELAFELAPAHWGQGLMGRAVTAVLDWAYQQDRIDRVHAYVRVDNRRSLGLLERSGFVREGCLRSYRVCRGQPHDFYAYARLRADWSAARGGVAK